jgi:hypothetical protein
MIIDLKAVTVRDGDVLLLTGGQFTPAFVQYLDAVLRGRGYNCLLLYSPDGGELQTLSEEAMGARGWQRVEIPEGAAKELPTNEELQPPAPKVAEGGKEAE